MPRKKVRSKYIYGWNNIAKALNLERTTAQRWFRHLRREPRVERGKKRIGGRGVYVLRSVLEDIKREIVAARLLSKARYLDIERYSYEDVQLDACGAAIRDLLDNPKADNHEKE